MSFQLDTASISHQLVVGQNYPVSLGLGPKTIRGSSYIESPSIFGSTSLFPSISAGVMIGPVLNTDSPVPIIPGSVCGLNFSPYSLSVVGDAAIFDNLSVNKTIATGRHVLAQGEVISRFNGGQHLLSLKKNFDIPHPAKQNWRLRHTCLEGPENGVYFRGKVKEYGRFSVDIDLPSYWVGFVDIDNITVTLTPFDVPQSLYYKLDGHKITVYSSDKKITTMKFDYQIFAERIDGEKLIPEYGGNSPNDYPGDNRQYSVVGWDYDKRNESGWKL